MDDAIRHSPVARDRTAFLSNGIECVGYIYRLRAQASGQQPCIVMAHGFGGTQEGSLAETASDFAKAGFMALTFDYRSFGESGGSPRQVISIAGQHADWHAAIAHARTLAGVDSQKIALWGSSLSGAHVVEVAVQDGNIGAVVAQVPFNGFPRKVEGRTTADAMPVLRAMLKDWWHGRTGRPPHYVPIVGQRGEIAVMPFDDAASVVRSMQNKTWRNQVAPRVVLEMMNYRPARHARRLTAPILVCLAQRDIQTPPYLGRQIADRAPLGELRRYPCTHFDIYKADIRPIVVADQISFLRTQLQWR